MTKRVLILPLYNEAPNIAPLLRRIFAVEREAKLNLSVIAINDCSRDKTGQIIQKLARQYPRLLIFNNPQNLGMAGTIQRGIGIGLKKGFDEFYFMDGDQTHDPTDLTKLARALEHADVAIGSRYVEDGGMVGVPRWRVWISVVGNWLFRVYLGVAVNDLTSGYRAMRQRYFEKITYKERSFAIQLESTARAVAAGFKIAEVPIQLKNREIGVSSFNYNFSTARAYLQLLLRLRRLVKQSPHLKLSRFDSARQAFKFILVGLVGTAIDFGLMNLLVLVFGLNLYLAVTFSFLAGFAAVFTLNRSWTFQRAGYKYSTGNQGARYLLVALIGFALNILITYWVINHLSWGLCVNTQTDFSHLITRQTKGLAGCINFARAIATAIVFIWNFFVNKYFTFRY